MRFCSNFKTGRVSICLPCICNIPCRGRVYTPARARRPDTQSIKFARHFTHYLVANSITALFMPYRGWSRNTAYAGWLVSDRIYLLPCIQVYETALQNRKIVVDVVGIRYPFFCFVSIPSVIFFFSFFVNRSIDFLILYSVEFSLRR